MKSSLTLLDSLRLLIFLQVEGQQGLFNTKKLASILVKVEDEADGSAPLSGKNFLGR